MKFFKCAVYIIFLLTLANLAFSAYMFRELRKPNIIVAPDPALREIKEHSMMADSPRSNQAWHARKTKERSTAEQHRQQRLKKALRKNLLKRKQQSRSRQQQQIMSKDSSAG